jgi:hypothetical protein
MPVLTIALLSLLALLGWIVAVVALVQSHRRKKNQCGNRDCAFNPMNVERSLAFDFSSIETPDEFRAGYEEPNDLPASAQHGRQPAQTPAPAFKPAQVITAEGHHAISFSTAPGLDAPRYQIDAKPIEEVLYDLRKLPEVNEYGSHYKPGSRELSKKIAPIVEQVPPMHHARPQDTAQMRKVG